MKHDMDSNPAKAVPLFLAVLGIITAGLLIAVNPSVLSMFSSDGQLVGSRVARIHRVQFMLGSFGFLLVLAGYLLYRFRPSSESKRRSNRTSWLLISIAVVYTLVTSEIILYIYPQLSTAERLGRSVAYVPSPYSVHRLDDFEQSPVDASGEVMFTISDGYRGGGFAPVKRDAEIRIVFLGGSFVFDPESRGMDDWPHMIESLLHEAGHTEVTVLNAGVPGHTTFDSIARLLSEIHAFQPDMVVLCHAWNDMKYFNRISVARSPLRVNRPLLRATHGNYPPSLFTRLSERLSIVRLMKAVPSMLRGRVDQEGLVPDEEIRGEVSELGLAQYRLNLGTFADICRNIGARPVLLVQPTLVTPENEEEVHDRVAYHWVSMDHEAICEAFQMCRDAVYATAEEKSCPVWDTGIAPDPENFADHVHLSRSGGRIFAALVAKAAEKELAASR